MATMQSFHSRQRGVALVTALVFLIIITALALAAMRSSTLELRMSANDEFATTAAQEAMGVAEAVSATPGSTPVVGDVGHRICNGVSPDDEVDCNDTTLVLPIDAAPQSGSFWVGVERLGSESRPPPRGIGSSLEQFGAAAFRVHSRYVDPQGNRADAYEGVLVLVPRTNN